jgi:hypothetical protein
MINGTFGSRHRFDLILWGKFMKLYEKSGAFASVRSFVFAGVITTFAAGLALSAAQAQGQNKAPVEKPKKSVGCPSGWSSTMNNETDTSRCFPQGTLSPKIYGKKESESCDSGYYEVYGVWCSTKKP